MAKVVDHEAWVRKLKLARSYAGNARAEVARLKEMLASAQGESRVRTARELYLESKVADTTPNRADSEVV